MDTKARVAVIVGGVVLVGMVAWVLMPGGKPEAPADTDQPLVDSTETSVTPTDQFAAAPSTMAATQPVVGVDPFASTATLPSAPTVDIGPSLTPADSTDAWSRALDGNGPAATPSLSSAQPARDGFSTNFTQTGFDTTTTTTTVIPPEPISANTPKTYTIATGDSLYTVSERIYGNAKYVNKIIAANPGVDPKRLKVGQTIKLPDANATATETVSAAPTSPVSAGSTYKVQSGDSLRKIATKVYGDAGKWERLYSANRSLIGSDPSRLRAGMVLKVPAN